MTDRWNDASPEAQHLASEYYEIDLAEMLVTAQAEKGRAEAAIARVRKYLADLERAGWSQAAIARRIREALDEPASGPAAAEPVEVCRPVEVDGETIRVRGSGQFTEREREFAAEIVRAAKRKYAAEHPEPAPAVIREQIAAAIWERQNPGRRWADCEYRWRADAEADADAVLAVILPTTRLTGDLHRQAEADVQRVIDLYERWVKAGPPPLGTSMARWWDRRLVELHNAIHPKEQRP